jgi:hypothetical protein
VHHSFCNFVVEPVELVGERPESVGNTDVVHRLSTRPEGLGLLFKLRKSEKIGP